MKIQTLKEWLASHKIAPYKMATQCKVSPSTVYEWVENKRLPQKAVREKINRYIAVVDGKAKAFPCEYLFIQQTEPVKKTKKQK